MGEKAQQRQGRCEQGLKEGLERKEEGQEEEEHRHHHRRERDEEERGEGCTEASEPKSKVMCGRPLSIAMGMSGRMGGGSAIDAENDFAIMMRKRAHLSTGLRADGQGTPEGGGGREETDEFGDGLGGGR
jgi:hypothetical protein